MCHQPGTADRYYNLAQARDLALPVSGLIAATMTGSEADPDVPGPSIPLPAAPLALEEAPAAPLALEEAPAAPLALEEAPAAPLAVEENPASPKEPDYSDDVIPPTPPVPGPRVLFHGRRSFTPDEVETLFILGQRLLHQRYISQGEAVTELMKTEEGRAYCLQMKTVFGDAWKKKMADRLRTECRRRAKLEQPPQPPQ
uniref:Uncharacterized protein LOC111117845 n=1 Tax=Crassostrea virginica TaxID=6565 RepID=A0A8B8CAK1_CRAVI|nr:uncharacterized protein LOC111117845 [Crassostrea virginica]